MCPDVSRRRSLPSGVRPLEGMGLRVLAHPLVVKGALERWGVVFPQYV
jgi:hypothetical protein